MNLILLLFMALPQDYMNLIMQGKYVDAVNYCDVMIDKGKDVFKWQIEKGDIYLDKIGDFGKATEIYSNVIEKHKKKDGWYHYRLALALEMNEDYLNAAKSYEVVATQFRKFPLDSFALNGVERCFKKNYQDFVATIDGYNITRLELDELIAKRSTFAKRDEKAILDQMIVMRLLFVSAIKNSVRETDFFKDAMEDKKKSLLLEEINAVEIAGKALPTEKKMKKYYRKNKKNFELREEIKGKEIIVESDSLAKFLLDSLEKDIESFNTLAKLHSTASTKRSSGNMGVVYRDSKPKSVDKVLFKAKLNELIGIIQFDDKFGIYLVTEHKPKRRREFDKVRNQIEATLKAENIKSLEEKFMKNLKKKAKFEIYEDIMSDSARVTEDKVVAIVNGREILRSFVEKRNESQPNFARVNLTDSEELKKLLNTIIEEELKIEWAERKKYFLNDGFVAKWKVETEGLMANGLYRKIVVDAVSIDSQEVKDYYEEHKEEFKILETVKCQEIVVDSLNFAKEIRKFLLENPEKFDSLAKEHSIAPTGKRGGTTGSIRKGTKPKKFEDIAFKLPVGSISKVFSVDDSTYTVIKLVEHNPVTYRTFNEVGKNIETGLLRQKQREVADAFLAKVREEAEIEIFLSEPEKEGETKEEEIKKEDLNKKKE